MKAAGPPRPRVARETRLLLATILLSIAALWILARVRFPDRPGSANPVQPLLTQLAPRPGYDDLAYTVFQLQATLAPSLVPIDAFSRTGGGRLGALQGLRVSADSAVALLQPGLDGGLPVPGGGALQARDPASGLALIRVSTASAPAFALWSPRRLDYPRYVIASDGPSLRPVFIGGLVPSFSAVWGAQIWHLPLQTALSPGSFVFSVDGELAGIVVERDSGAHALVPGDVLLTAIERLRTLGAQPPGEIGVTVDPLPAAIAGAPGRQPGVVVTWVDPTGPAATLLRPTDVIESIGGQPVTTLEHWRARVDRIVGGETLALEVRRGGSQLPISITAHTRGGGATNGEPGMGLTLRQSPGGILVQGVDAGSAAASAGLRATDLITAVESVDRPTPPQLIRAFAALPAGGALLIGYTRGTSHHVAALVKR